MKTSQWKRKIWTWNVKSYVIAKGVAWNLKHIYFLVGLSNFFITLSDGGDLDKGREILTGAILHLGVTSPFACEYIGQVCKVEAWKVCRKD